MGDAPVYYSLIADGNHTHETVQRIAHKAHPEGLEFGSLPVKTCVWKNVIKHKHTHTHTHRCSAGDRRHGGDGSEEWGCERGSGREPFLSGRRWQS